MLGYQAILGNSGPQARYLPLLTLPGVSSTVASSPDLTQMTIPVLLLSGELDLFVIPKSNALAGALFPHAQVEELRGAPHFMLLTHVKEVAYQLISFIQHTKAPFSFNLATSV